MRKDFLLVATSSANSRPGLILLLLFLFLYVYLTIISSGDNSRGRRPWHASLAPSTRRHAMVRSASTEKIVVESRMINFIGWVGVSLFVLCVVLCILMAGLPATRS
jgi:hypothetical protein